MSSPLLPQAKGELLDSFFIGDSSGIYVLLPANDYSTSFRSYLWYNHTDSASGWQHVELPKNAYSAEINNLSGYALGSVCITVSIDTNQSGVSCLNTLSANPSWSQPVALGLTQMMDASTYPQKNGAWISYQDQSGMTGILNYNATTKKVIDTHFSTISDSTEPLTLKVAPDNNIVVCEWKNNGDDQLYVYKNNPLSPVSSNWKPLPYKNIGLHECVIANDDLGNLDGFWLENNPQKKNLHKQRRF